MAAAEDDPMKGQKGVPPAALKAKEEYFRSPEEKRVAAHIDFYGPPRAKGPLPYREFSSISDHPEDIERRKNEHKRSPYGELEDTALETTAHFTETEEDSIRQNKVRCPPFTATASVSLSLSLSLCLCVTVTVPLWLPVSLRLP